MANQRMINKIRTDYLENQIAHYRVRGFFEAEDALRRLARDIAAPIDEQSIIAATKIRLREYNTGDDVPEWDR